MENGPGDRAVVEAFFEVLRDGGVDRLGAIVAEGCVDFDPLPGQLAGRAGVAQKVMLFRAAHPDARITILAVEPVRGGARATWRTTARGLGGAPGEATWQFTSVMEIAGERIQSSRVEKGEQVR